MQKEDFLIYSQAIVLKVNELILGCDKKKIYGYKKTMPQEKKVSVSEKYIMFS